MNDTQPSPRYIPKNRQYATVQDLPVTSLPVSEFIQGPRYDRRSQKDSNIKGLLMQNHEQRLRQQEEMENRARETQEMAQKVQEFRQEQALSERRRKQEQLELFNYNKFGKDENRRRDETLRKQKEIEEKEMIQQAVIGLVNEEREIFKKASKSSRRPLSQPRPRDAL